MSATVRYPLMKDSAARQRVRDAALHNAPEKGRNRHVPDRHWIKSGKCWIQINAKTGFVRYYEDVLVHEAREHCTTNYVMNRYFQAA